MICCCGKTKECCCCSKNEQTNHSNGNTENVERVHLLCGANMEANSANSNYQSTNENCQNSLESLVDLEKSCPSIELPLCEGKMLKHFNDMLKKCVEISNSDFSNSFHRYASFSMNRHRYFCRHPTCMENNHKEFTNCCSIEPVLYYAVMDWESLRKEAKGLYLYNCHATPH